MKHVLSLKAWLFLVWSTNGSAEQCRGLSMACFGGR
jgi:hypothetical protein